MPCPEWEVLEHHVTATTGEDESARVSEHLASCPSCSRRAEEISENLQAIPALRTALREAAPPSELPAPERIGAFRVLREIARGGMGVVYLAEQERPRRRVALKVLRATAASPDTLRRFELEAESLARLRHPGIATIFEAGVTTLAAGAAAEKIPYIAMEYVRGERLDEHCRANGLSLGQRLELVARVADAVHHAHVKGLVHRDLKPGNILVERTAGEVVTPKVLDFGVARVADREGTLHTSTGQLLGTVPYMSPEQLAGDPSAVDARSDVYALGVVAFELVTGRLPHDVKNTSIADAARVIRDEAPRAPEALEPTLRGDAATILKKALEKNPERRYASAAELAADIRRFLAREPILARPQSTVYQLRRFAARNRALVATAAVLVLTLLAGAFVAGMLALRATRAEKSARQQLVEARRQAVKFEAVNRFLEEMLGTASPEENPGGRSLTVREALDRGRDRLDDGSLDAQPEIELGVRATIGNAYRALGEFEDARAQLERAVELGRRAYPAGHPDLADAINKLARVVELAREDDLAETLFRESLEMHRRTGGPRSEPVATVLNNLAHLLAGKGDSGRALELHEEALAIRRELFGETHEDIANSLNNIAVIHYGLGDHARAETLLRESLEMDRRLRGELHPNVAQTMNNLAMAIAAQDRADEAETLHRRALELEREIYGPDHPKLVVSLQNLALLLARGGSDEAESLFEEALAVGHRAYGPRHPAVANVLGNYARLFSTRGQYDRAEQLHLEALEIRRETLGDASVEALGSRYSLARLYRDRGETRRAVEAFAGLAEDARQLGESSAARFAILADYGLYLHALARSAEAAAVLTEARAVGATAVAAEHPRLREVREALNGLASR